MSFPTACGQNFWALIMLRLMYFLLSTIRAKNIILHFSQYLDWKGVKNVCLSAQQMLFIMVIYTLHAMFMMACLSFTFNFVELIFQKTLQVAMKKVTFLTHQLCNCLLESQNYLLAAHYA